MADELCTESAGISGVKETLGKREATKLLIRKRLALKNEERVKLRQIRSILRKEMNQRSSDDVEYLCRYPKLVNELSRRKEKKRQLEERIKEREDHPETLKKKCDVLAEAIKYSKHMVVYTGAGISTAASIPDYRGPDGVWTKLSKGENLTMHSICDADPTLTHMSLVTLHQHGRVKHIVSQNCDGLHVRSGLPSDALSEIHGNMFAEICEGCDPQRIYWRLFDVTEHTGLRRHATNRKCHKCGSVLLDTIVHFGEKRNISYPQNWHAAFEHAKKADMILCLGSSLKVLKSYHGLWGMNRVKVNRPELYIVNLQWTPKDNVASLKINGRVDDVMQIVMDRLKYSIINYNRLEDPLLKLNTPLTCQEYETHATKAFVINKDENFKQEDECMSDQMDFLSSSIKEDLISNDDKSVSCGNEMDSQHPGWFGKGIRKIKNRKRRK